LASLKVGGGECFNNFTIKLAVNKSFWKIKIQSNKWFNENPQNYHQVAGVSILCIGDRSASMQIKLQGEINSLKTAR